MEDRRKQVISKIRSERILMNKLGIPAPEVSYQQKFEPAKHQKISEHDLHGEKKTTPNLRIDNEKYKHRIVMALVAQGKTNREVAEISGYSETWLSQLTRQPWFREQLTSFIDEHAGDALTKILEGQVIPSVFTLVSIRDDEEASSAVRVTASNSLLDRYLGKPTQKVDATMTAKPYDANRIDQELREVEAELARLDVAPTAEAGVVEEKSLGAES